VPVAYGAQTPNLIVETLGSTKPKEIIVIGAHYDTCMGTPGADDNATGVAGVLALARAFAGRPQARTLRFALFVNEEPPTFQTPDMGSWVYAKACRARGDNIVAMFSLESIGYYCDEPGSQKYPPPVGLFYPSKGDFIAFIGNGSNRALVRRCIRQFRSTTQFPSEGAAVPAALPGVGWSDHWSFWQEGYPALMVTCTAPFRNPNYHKPGDTPETLDYERLARVVMGVERVVVLLAAE
jgi:Zn-dependent M28 family amino/carboxypeptidase